MIDLKYLFDYIEEKSNISFEELPLTEVDNVIFSRLVYLDFSNFINKTLAEAAEEYQYSQRDESKLFNKTTMLTQELLRLAAETKRYGGIIIFDFKEIASIDYATSFCACVFKIESSPSFIAFRGTDDKIMSFYEDAELAYSFPIPSQVAALRFTRSTLQNGSGDFFLGGHSKGGNLALFSYVFLDDEMKKRISEIFNNDGPGFPKDIVKILITPEINKKTATIAPEDSIIGRLLDTSDDYIIVKSSAAGGSQHNVFTWLVDGDKFERAEKFGTFSEFVEENLEDSLKFISLSDMKKITQTVYNVAVKNGIKSADDMNASTVRNTLSALREIAKAEEETANEAQKVVRILIKNLFNKIDGDTLKAKFRLTDKKDDEQKETSVSN